jgi:hypothetical protein
MRLARLALLLFLFFAGAVRAGSITLNNGKRLEGTVSLVGGGGAEACIQFKAPNNPAKVYKRDEIRAAVFDGLPGGTVVSAGGVPWVRTEIGEDRRSPVVQIAGDRIAITDLQAPTPTRPPPRKAPETDSDGAADPLPAENMCFIFQKLDWDGEIIAHITLVDALPHPGHDTPGDPPKAALMICEGLDGLGPMAVLSRTAHGPISFVRRGARSEDPSPVNTTRGTAPPGTCWLKLTRSWDSFRALESADGITWNPVADARIEMDDRKGVYIGIAARGPASFVFDSIRLSGRRSAAVAPGEPDPRLRDVAVMLKDGTILTGMLESVTPDGQGQIKIAAGEPQRISLKSGVITRAQFAPMNAEQTRTLLAADIGALTRDGDFLEGELKNIRNGSVTVSSITFGLTTLEPGRVLGIVLQPPPENPPVRTATEVRLQDGSLLMARTLKVDKDQLEIDEPLIGPVTYPLQEVISISRK